ncbi:penicillin-binding protein [Oscillospiraceae bacterium]|nr:penicillin-binding protein [Oscillospiraceae bacterium]BDF75470.1 penicillin-binding protein [Oscillospiraceae bacterium]
MELTKSALRIMDILWDNGDTSAKDMVERLNAAARPWNKNTTYTVINRCIKNGLVERKEPGFICHALVSRQEAQSSELKSLVDGMFKGSPKLLFSALVNGDALSEKDRQELRRLIEELK